MKSILILARTEECKALRRKMHDKGMKFNNGSKFLAPKGDDTSNTITSVQKDNLLIEVYENNPIVEP